MSSSGSQSPTFAVPSTPAASEAKPTIGAASEIRLPHTDTEVVRAAAAHAAHIADATASPAALFSWQNVLALVILLGVLVGPFVVMQKKLLPRGLTLVLGRIYFWPTLPLTYLRSWMNGRGLWCRIDDTLLLGVAPVSMLRHPDQLEALGVRGVVNMCGEYAGPEADYRTLKIQQLRLPTVDHFEPELKDLKKAVEFIEQHRKNGHSVYVHCKAGHGRAGAVALAWLAYSRGVPQEDSLEELNKELLKKRRVRKQLFRQPNLRAFAAELKADAKPFCENAENAEEALRQRKR
eukprot:TRINITY_DN109867_c0_g1_i1.p1 TRINITY_DN109867_c0_g1~~TRINITY_DN109867_c0_g1_i1.p1  ORF type:complete len:306 (+),score=55.27 TRINITY_DN109867_c0_g1_i1:43-918(+)